MTVIMPDMKDIAGQADKAGTAPEDTIANPELPTPTVARVVQVVDYDPQWPEQYRNQANRILAALDGLASQIEHIGSTSVPGLAAKPVIDVLVVVADSADEDAYVPSLVSAGYALRIREPEWYEHRMFKGSSPETNIHVFSLGCEEIDRVLTFRNWLRANPGDRDLYARTKLALARQDWKHVQEYADSKTPVIAEIMARANLSGK
jgi:GrpB-like predicted nucleotidyltransferase (UPF0157 family)